MGESVASMMLADCGLLACLWDKQTTSYISPGLLCVSSPVGLVVFERCIRQPMAEEEEAAEGEREGEGGSDEEGGRREGEMVGLLRTSQVG